MVDVRNEVVNYVFRNGPLLPAQIAKNFNIDFIFAGAILSELVSKKKLKISYTKRGSSPFYYAVGQESKLQNISSNLGGKPKEAYDLIKENKIIRDSTAEPWQRVALREIRDYALPFQVNVGGKPEIFWKWYLLKDDDVSSLLNNESEKEIVEKESEKELIEKPKVEEQKHLDVEKKEEKHNEINVEKTVKKEIKKDIFNIEDVDLFFDNNKIYTISKEVVRKNREIDYIVDVPSSLGKLRYYVKFKNKKTINDKDLEKASKDADLKNLPLLFLTNGNLTKKAEKYMNQNQSGKLVYSNI